MVERQVGKVKDASSRSGGAAFDFIVKFSTGKSENLFVMKLSFPNSTLPSSL